MKTRLLETKEVFKGLVKKIELREQGKTHAVFTTSGVLAVKKNISSADSAMLDQARLAGVGQPVAGTLRLDVLSDTALRVRYAEGATVSGNDTPMIAAWPAPPTACRVQTPEKAVELATPAMRVSVSLDPFRISVCDASGRLVAAIGGPEKDQFNAWDAYGTGLCRTLDGTTTLAAECFALRPQEAIFGLGERFLRLNKVGQTADLDMVDALGVTTPRAYKNIPFFVSTAGYGVFFNHSSRMTVWVGSMSAADVQVAAEDDFLDYVVFLGDIKTVLAQYVALTGRGSVPPDWTFGYWQSKISYQSAEETLDVVRQLRAHEVPCDVIHLDTHWFKQDWYCNLEFDTARFPDPAAYMAELRRLGVKVSLWQLPYIPEGSDLFEKFRAVDGFVKTRDGGIYNVGVCFTKDFKGTVGCIDFTNPAAVRVYQEELRRLFQLGARVVKTDFGEAAPLDGVYHDGTPGHRMHNLYPLLYNRAAFEVTREATGGGVVWARSAWAGSQQYPVHWGGDNSPNWANMIPQIEGGLSLGLSGFQFWSQDIGGFCGHTWGELLIRWMQMSMFLSHSRIHGFGPRELYRFPENVLRVCRDYIRLRYRLLPYILGEAESCVERSLPMARALVVEFPDDPTTWNIGDQWLFGDSLLVAPITDATDRRRVYLPRGVWTDWWTGARTTGPCWIDVAAGIETLPLYAREGAVIAMGPVMNYVGEKPVDRLQVRVARFTADGITRVCVPVNGRQVKVVYESAAGKHVVRVGGCPVPVDVEALDSGAGAPIILQTVEAM
jgi:alpha-D-xyloside xylohydrolase